MKTSSRMSRLLCRACVTCLLHMLRTFLRQPSEYASRYVSLLLLGVSVFRWGEPDSEARELLQKALVKFRRRQVLLKILFGNSCCIGTAFSRRWIAPPCSQKKTCANELFCAAIVSRAHSNCDRRIRCCRDRYYGVSHAPTAQRNSQWEVPSAQLAMHARARHLTACARKCV